MKKWIPKNEQDEKINDLFLKSKKVNCYLERFQVNKGKSTYNGYKHYLREFFIFIKENPDTYLKDKTEIRNLSRNEELEYKDKLEKEIEEFLLHLTKSDKKVSPKSFGTVKVAIKGLLEKCRIDLGDSYWKEITKLLPKARAIGERETPTKEQLKNILKYMDVKGKALFTFQMTSFSRIDEILKLTFDDLQLDYDFPRVKTSYQYTKNSKMALKRISPEAKEFLLDYLKIRENWIKSKLKRAGIKDEKKLKISINEENRVFPMTIQNAIDIWNNALKKAGLLKKDPDSKRTTMGTHSLRRYAKNNFIKAYKGNGDENGKYWANIFMNKVSESDRVYDSYANEDLDRQYSFGIDGLILFKELVDHDIRYKEMKNEIEQLKEDVTRFSDLSRKLLVGTFRDVDPKLGHIDPTNKEEEKEIINELKKAFEKYEENKKLKKK